MTPEQDLYKQALAAIHAGDLAKAREILTRLLRSDRKNVDYWVWMSTVVVTTKERVYCLREVLALDPDNQDAALGLRLLGEKAPELKSPLPLQFFHSPWKTRLELAEAKSAFSHGVRSRVVVYSLLGVAIIGLFVFGAFLALKPADQKNESPIKRWAITPLPTTTETITPNSSSTGPAPLSILLDKTFTPTPLYVATPHNRLEAYNAAMRAYEKEDWTKAAEYFKQVLVDEPNSADIYYHLGNTYRFMGMYKEASAAFESAVKIDPNFAPAYLGKGQVLLESSSSKAKEAQSALQMAIERDPQLYEAYLELANASLALEDGNAALGWLDKLNTGMPDNALVELDRARAYLLLGDDKKAISSIEKANKIDRSLLSVYKIWAQALQANGDYSASIPPLLTVLANDPLDLGSEALLASAYFETGSTDKAVTLISTALQQDDKYIDAYLLRADIYLQQGKIDEATSDFNTVLRLDYNNFEANLGKGRILLAQTLAGAAYNQFDYSEKFAKTDSQKAVLLYWRAVALVALDETSAAINHFETALAYPGNLLPATLRKDAEKQLAGLYTPTPTQKATLTSTANPTATVTPTPSKSSTPAHTTTPLPSVTP